jgi:hypothetical protein
MAVIACLCALACSAASPARAETRSGATDHRIHVPEPMFFDLVRGLGARQNETEANVLAQFPLNRGNERSIEWAPEVELAVFDDVGLELELPFHDGTLDAYKFAAQFTFGQSESRRFIHGTQLIVEKARHQSKVETSALYIPAHRFDEHWSTLWMIGARTEFGDDREHDLTLLLNGTVFYESGGRATYGVETNFASPGGGEETILLMPQVHLELALEWTLQLGMGVEFGVEKTDGTAAVRLITTF